jgi:hypothetical protein
MLFLKLAREKIASNISSEQVERRMAQSFSPLLFPILIKQAPHNVRIITHRSPVNSNLPLQM